MWGLIALLLMAAAASGSASGTPSPTQPTPAPADTTLTYISHDRRGQFRFRFALRAGEWRIYVLHYPAPECGASHLLSDNCGEFICWSSTIRSLSEARRIAAEWAELTLTGAGF